MPVAIPHFDAQNQVQGLPPICLGKELKLEIRPATVADVHGMSALINHYASSNVMLARGPQYLYQHIQDYMVVTAPARDKDHEVVVACGALHVLWSDLAEIRSIAVHAGCQGQNWGKKIVQALVERCRVLQIPRVLYLPWKWNSSANAVLRNSTGKSFPPLSGLSAANAPNFIAATKWA